MITGKQIEIKELTSNGLGVILDNGVSIWISFNNNEINLAFSGINYEKSVGIRELEWKGTPVKLGNNFSIQYQPKET